MYNIDISNNKNIILIKYWLLLAISALAIAGLFSLPPVILRGSFFEGMLDVDHIFATSLVIHVDMSVIIWMLSIGGVLWSIYLDNKFVLFQQTSLILAVAGTLLISISPLIGNAEPLKNNYIPVLQTPVFFMGLALFGFAILILILATLIDFKKAKNSVLNLGIYIAAFVTFISFICFIIAQRLTPSIESIGNHNYYESLFWGGGHVLQFTFTILTLICWLWIATKCNIKFYMPKALAYILFSINILIILPSPFFYLGEDGINQSVSLFTKQMWFFGGVSAFFIGLFISIGCLNFNNKNTQPHAIKASLVLSILLFGYGGLLAYNISGVNVTIPAHYHGSIVSMTLIFMGLVYFILPKLGYLSPKGKIFTTQPYIYAIGQFMHITGLAWMGGYGALRKSAGSSASVDNIIPKLMFFSGGALAIIGGLLFVIVAFRAIKCKSL